MNVLNVQCLQFLRRMLTSLDYNSVIPQGRKGVWYMRGVVQGVLVLQLVSVVCWRSLGQNRLIRFRRVFHSDFMASSFCCCEVAH